MKNPTLYFCSECGAELEIREGDWRLGDSGNLVAYCEGCWRKQSAGSASGRSYLDIKSNRREPLLGRGSLHAPQPLQRASEPTFSSVELRANSQDEKRVANDGALYTRAQFERYYKDRADLHWQWAAMRRQIDEAPLPATKVVRTAFDEDRIQRKIDEIVRALDEALGAEEIPRIYFPSTACALVGEYGWWLSRGSVGSASSKCSESAVWCRHVVRRWWNHAASRLQRYLRLRCLRILRREEYCGFCDMFLNGPVQYANHVIGSKHIGNERRRTRLSTYMVLSNACQLREEILTSYWSKNTIGLTRTENELRNTECASILAQWARRINPKYKTQTRFGK